MGRTLVRGFTVVASTTHCSLLVLALLGGSACLDADLADGTDEAPEEGERTSELVAPGSVMSFEYYHYGDPNCPSGSMCSDTTRLRIQPGGAVYWGAIDGMTETDTTDTWFRKVAGRANTSCLSFESVKYPGSFLRHAGTQIVVQAGMVWDFNFNQDATFCLSSNHYEAYNSTGWYLRKWGSGLILSQIDTLNDYWSWRDTVLFERNGSTLGMYDQGLGLTSTDGGVSWYWESTGPCTGIHAPWESPKYSCTQYGIVLSNLPLWQNPTQIRPIINCSASTTWFGTYPRIRMTKAAPGALFHKIETSYGVCF
jgi:hypothetical protein